MKTLPEILEELAQECWLTGNRNKALSISRNYGTTLIPTQEAIAKELMGCLPEKRLKRNGEPTTNIATAEWGYNQALQDVRARLTAFIGKEK